MNQSNFEELTPINTNNNIELVFFPNGYVQKRNNGNTINSFGIYFYGFLESDHCSYLGSNYINFGIYLNNNTDSLLFGCINNDTLMISSGFIFDEFDDGCESEKSYFIKQ